MFIKQNMKFKQSELKKLERKTFIDALNDYLIANAGTCSEKLILKNEDFDELLASEYIQKGLKICVARRRKKSVEVFLSY